VIEAALEDEAMPKKYCVINPHRSPDPDPCIVRQGDRLSFERRPTIPWSRATAWGILSRTVL
jgi:hypothetical protein